MLEQVIRKRVVLLETKILNLCKQCISCWFCRVRNIQNKLVKKVAREPDDHTKDSELPDVEKFLHQASCQPGSIQQSFGYREFVSEDY